jgi:UDP-N-acetyl-D-mannosaminuronic acid dehydrogenase
MFTEKRGQAPATPALASSRDPAIGGLAPQTVCVVGLGYIGLPTAAMLASRGYLVKGAEINARAVESINNGQPHFYEPDLQMLLAAATKTGQLEARVTPSLADYFIIAVPTPFTDGKQPDLSHIDAACTAIAPYLVRGNVVILESTSPVGTTERIAEWLADARPDLCIARYKDAENEPDVFVCHCPERVLPGRMLTELVANDRLIGGMTDACAAHAMKLYESFVRGSIFTTDCRTAEFVKLIENAYRDVNIAFANELSLLSERFGIDIWSAITLANRHPRVNIMRPGPGVGGHCVAVDPWFLVAGAPDLAHVVRTARETNDAKPQWVVDRVLAMTRKLKRPTVACFGLAYKADVDDMRKSPAVEIVRKLAENEGTRILVVEPNVTTLPQPLSAFSNVTLVDAKSAVQEADVLAILVNHKQFNSLRTQNFLDRMVLDTVGLLFKT